MQSNFAEDLEKILIIVFDFISQDLKDDIRNYSMRLLKPEDSSDVFIELENTINSDLIRFRIDIEKGSLEIKKDSEGL